MASAIREHIRAWRDGFHAGIKNIQWPFRVRGQASARLGSLGREMGQEVDRHAKEVADEFMKDHATATRVSQTQTSVARLPEKGEIIRGVKAAAEREITHAQSEIDRLESAIATAKAETSNHQILAERHGITAEAIRRETEGISSRIDQFENGINAASRANADRERDASILKSAIESTNEAARLAEAYPDNVRNRLNQELHDASVFTIEKLVRSKFGLGNNFNLTKFNEKVRNLTGNNIRIKGLELFTPDTDYSRVADSIERLETEYRGNNRINWGLVGRGRIRDALSEKRGRSLRFRDVFEITGAKNQDEQKSLENKRDELIMREYLESHHGKAMADKLMGNFKTGQYGAAVDMLQRWARPDVIGANLSGAPRDWAQRIAEFMGSRNLVSSSPEAIAEGLRHPWKRKFAGVALAAAAAAALAAGTWEYAKPVLSSIQETSNYLINQTHIRKNVESFPETPIPVSAPTPSRTSAPATPKIQKNVFLDIAQRNIQQTRPNFGIRDDVYVAVALEGRARAKGWTDDKGHLKTDPATKKAMAKEAARIKKELDSTRSQLGKEGVIEHEEVPGKKGPQSDVMQSTRKVSGPLFAVARGQGFTVEGSNRFSTRYAEILESWENSKKGN